MYTYNVLLSNCKQRIASMLVGTTVQMSSADKFCKQFRPTSGLENVWPDLDKTCFWQYEGVHTCLLKRSIKTADDNKREFKITQKAKIKNTHTHTHTHAHARTRMRTHVHQHTVWKKYFFIIYYYGIIFICVLLSFHVNITFISSDTLLSIVPKIE